MSHDKTKEEILTEATGKEGIYLTRGSINGSDALYAMEEYAVQQTKSLQHQLTQAKGEIERIMEDNNKEQQAIYKMYVEERDKSTSLQSLLTQKDKEIEAVTKQLEETQSDRDNLRLINIDLQGEIEALRVGVNWVLTQYIDHVNDSDEITEPLESLLNPSNEKG
jgi:chromosome segregation ATPase